MPIATVDPTSGETVQTFEPHDPSEVERRLARAQQAFEFLGTTTSARRAGWLRTAADHLEADRDLLADTLVTEMGKPIAQAEAEVHKCATAMRRYAVQNNGQSCIAAQRFIVHTDVFDEFAELFARRMSELVVGDPRDRATDVGPLATESGRRELAELVGDAVARGAEVLTGGSAPDGPGWFYRPTVPAGIPPDMRIANGTEFGLSSAVWTDDADEADHGRELSAAGIREFCNLKTAWRG